MKPVKTEMFDWGAKFKFDDGSYCVKLYDGEERWYDADDDLHRVNDKPAFIGADGTKEWWVNDKRHRDNDQPAIIQPDGPKEWWVNDKRHRDNDQPAIMWADGMKEWWVDNELHRDNDQPACIGANGTMEWWTNSKRHRGNGQPAIIYADGEKQWWVSGKHIRTENPEHKWSLSRQKLRKRASFTLFQMVIIVLKAKGMNIGITKKG